MNNSKQRYLQAVSKSGKISVEERAYRKALYEKRQKEIKEQASQRAHKTLNEYEYQQQRYSQYGRGKASSIAGSVLGFLQKGGATRFGRGQPTYSGGVGFVAPPAPQIKGFRGMKSNGRQTVMSQGTNRRGRPKGTLDRRYAEYGGVYGYRKFLAAKLREAKMNAYRRNTVSPRQEMILAQDTQRQQAVQQNPERQIIPNTSGRSQIGSYWDEINSAANIFP